MKVVSVVSAKGGVGKSTVSANLAAALQQQGHTVLAIDLDPQNGLRYHFTLEPSSMAGLVQAPQDADAWRALIRPTESGVALIPYGDCTEPERQAFEAELRTDASWLISRLRNLELGRGVIVVIDTPPGPSAYMTQALTAASLAVAVVLPDAGSYATLPQLNTLISTYCEGRDNFSGYGFVVNQVDQGQQLSKDITQVLRTTFRDRMAGLVHLDQSLSEALAHGKNIFQYRPHSVSARDLVACAQWVAQRLDL